MVYENGYYVARVKIEPGYIASDCFDIHDRNYYNGDTKRRPADFDLHLALYLLQKEQLPKDMLEPLKRWAHENKMLVAP